MAGGFAEALEQGDIGAVRAIPKADLHRHAYFATRLENVERWLGRSIPKPPARMEGLDGMLGWAAEWIDPTVNNREGFQFVAESALEEAIDDGVFLLEMSFDIRTAAHFADGVSGLCHAIRDLRERYADQIDLRPELGIPRGIVGIPEKAVQIREALDTGSFDSVDLYGLDEECPPEAAKGFYDQTKALGMRLKAHVGEFGGAGEVRRTAEVLELDAIQHGIAAAESDDVMKWLSERQIPLHVCPTSNVMLGSATSIESHPIRILYDHGVKVTVNTDDPMVFGTGVSEEYLALYEAGVFSGQELDGIRKSAMEGTGQKWEYGI